MSLHTVGSNPSAPEASQIKKIPTPLHNPADNVMVHKSNSLEKVADYSTFTSYMLPSKFSGYK